jgi:hypothetical protein
MIPVSAILAVPTCESQALISITWSFSRNSPLFSELSLPPSGLPLLYIVASLLSRMNLNRTQSGRVLSDFGRTKKSWTYFVNTSGQTVSIHNFGIQIIFFFFTGRILYLFCTTTINLYQCFFHAYVNFWENLRNFLTTTYI